MRISIIFSSLLFCIVFSCQRSQENEFNLDPPTPRMEMPIPDPSKDMDAPIDLKRANFDLEPEISNPKLCLPSQFCFEQPQIQPNQINQMWGLSNTDMWAVGENGTILHFDGTVWSWMDSGTNEPILQIWGPTKNKVWAVTSSGNILFYNGTTWNKQFSASFDKFSFLDVPMFFGSGSDDDVWLWGPPAFMNKQQVYRYDAKAAAWSTVDVDAYFKTSWKWDIHQFWMESANHFWMVGEPVGFYPKTAVVLYFDGTALTEKYTFDGDSHAGAQALAITGTGPNDIWIAGQAWNVSYDATFVKHFDGTTWSDKWVPKPYSFPGDYNPAAVRLWVTGSTVWLRPVGAIYPMYRYNGTYWEGIYWPSPRDYTNNMPFWLTDESHFWWAYYNEPLLWDGNKTTRFAREPASIRSWTALWGSQPDKMWALGFGANSYVIRFDGKYWKTEFTFPLFLSSMWGTAEDDIWMGGDGLSLFHFDGIKWTLIHQVSQPEMGKQTILNIWGTAKNNIWAVGRGGVILHYDGKAWNQVNSGVTEDLQKVWGFDSNDVWMMGGKNTILHFDGSTQTLQKVATSGLEDSTVLYSLLGISKTKDMNGKDVRTFYLSGGQADTYTTPSGERVPKGILWKGDGESFTKVDYGSEQAIFDLWFDGTSSVWAAARGGLILKYDGTAWSTINDRGISFASAKFFSLDSKLFVFGDSYSGTGFLLSH